MPRGVLYHELAHILLHQYGTYKAGADLHMHCFGGAMLNVYQALYAGFDADATYARLERQNLGYIKHNEVWNVCHPRLVSQNWDSAKPDFNTWKDK